MLAAGVRAVDYGGPVFLRACSVSGTLVQKRLNVIVVRVEKIEVAD
jgi:hypothetical protein